MSVPLMSMCCFRKSTSVSLLKWGLGVIYLQTVAILSALFCVISRCCMCAVFVPGCPTVWLYVGMGLMYCLYTRVMFSLDRPNVVLVSVRRTLSQVFALVFMFFGVCDERLFFCHIYMSLRVWWLCWRKVWVYC